MRLVSEGTSALPLRWVMRALMVMAQRGEIQERAEGRRVTRVH